MKTGSDMKKGEKLILILFAVILGLILVVAVVLWSMFGNLAMAMNSITELEDGLYTIEYKGDYGLDQLLEDGGVRNETELKRWVTEFFSHGLYDKLSKYLAEGEAWGFPENFGCSSIVLENGEGGYTWGRNFDWKSSDAIIVHTVPDDGYESVGVFCTSFLGNLKPLDSLKDRVYAAASVYGCLDGMNEKGLMIAVLMSGDNNKAAQNTDKADLTTSTMIRLVLDKAATVDEALALFESYDMHAMDAYHFAIADASGRSVVVEYHNDVMAVAETNIVTNFMLTELAGGNTGSEESHERYEILEGCQGPADPDEMLDIMMSVAKFNFREKYKHKNRTVWTLICQPDELQAQLYFDEKWDHCYSLELGVKDWVKYFSK